MVGVDGSAGSAHALQWAARQAGYTGATLEAVVAWQYPAFFGWAPVGADGADFGAIAGKTLDDALNAVFGPQWPDWVQARVVEGYPAQVLVAESEGADLLVVGSRGRRVSPTRCSARSARTACSTRTGRSPSSGLRAGITTEQPGPPGP